MLYVNRKLSLWLLSTLILTTPAFAVETSSLGTFTLLKVFDGARNRPNFVVTKEGRHLFEGSAKRFSSGDRVHLIEIKTSLSGTLYRMCLIDGTICSDHLTRETDHSELMLTSKRLHSRSKQKSDLIEQIRNLQRREANLLSQLENQYDH
ncbi:hypothetical protein F0267_00595 [Vibrio coralliilyticus]|uniref:Uncharacterized protein n=1 Tax=Vibrio coralliilyticus TaxID=190893 RepID=A0AAN0W087_9VIBR|nr:hypothetical protein [Vibrio coralliilyticus]AIW22623.1 hypothetical protein IX92_26535 [Vibrio coralliilyticus]NOH36718.1 hypothetical protein [Vibrio coralliilyticus]